MCEFKLTTCHVRNRRCQGATLHPYIFINLFLSNVFEKKISKIMFNETLKKIRELNKQFSLSSAVQHS